MKLLKKILDSVPLLLIWVAVVCALILCLAYVDHVITEDLQGYQKVQVLN